MKDLVKLKHLFTPTRIKSMELKNRIAMAPMGTLMANEDGNPSERQAAYYEARARGGAGHIRRQVHPRLEEAQRPHPCRRRQDLGPTLASRPAVPGPGAGEAAAG